MIASPPSDGECYVGRAAELATVQGAIAEAASEGACLVWIEGEAGAGKTALIAKITAELAARGTLLRMAADENAADRSFWVTRQIGITGTDGPFAAGLALLDRFGATKSSEPTVVIVEDLHWADRGSRLALLTAAQRLERDAVVMLVTSRPDAGGDDGRERFCVENSRCRRVVLSGLRAEDVDEMGRAGAAVAHHTELSRVAVRSHYSLRMGRVIGCASCSHHAVEHAEHPGHSR
jgi:hypothetical protein